MKKRKLFPGIIKVAVKFERKLLLGKNRFCRTMGWFGVYLQNIRRIRIYTCVVVIVMFIEQVIITRQAANGRLSHFQYYYSFSPVTSQYFGHSQSHPGCMDGRAVHSYLQQAILCWLYFYLCKHSRKYRSCSRPALVPNMVIPFGNQSQMAMKYFHGPILLLLLLLNWYL